MNKRLITKLNKLEKMTINTDNILSYDTIVEEIRKNKDFSSDFYIETALEYFKEHDITVTKDENKVDTNITVPKIKSILNKLLVVAQSNNNIIEDTDIVKAFSNDKELLTTEVMTNIFDFLEENDVEVITIKSAVDANMNEDDIFSDKLDDELIELTKKKELPKEDSRIEESTKAPDGFSEYMKDISKYGTDLLTLEEEQLLSKAVQNGDKAAFNRVATSNLKLVVSIAKRYTGLGLSMEDLVQEGNIGLLTAIKKYDPNLGFRFSTYATWWIRQAITRSLANDARIIKMPAHAVEQARVNQRAMYQLSEKLNRIPTDEELSKYINENKMFASSSVKNIPPETVRLYSQYYSPGSVVSLQTPFGNDGAEDNSFLEDFIEDHSNKSVEETVESNEINALINQVLDEVLTEKEANILKMRFGIDCDYAMTLEEVGKYYKVTRERIRQIEAKAIRKVRKSRKTRKLLNGYSEGPMSNLLRF